MLDELRDRIIRYLSEHQTCVVSTSGVLGAWAVFARYQSHGLEIECRIPAWSDAVYHLERDPHALVIVPDADSSASRWLQYRGVAHLNLSRAGDRYVAVDITPERVDLIDEQHSWGARETLEL